MAKEYSVPILVRCYVSGHLILIGDAFPAQLVGFSIAKIHEGKLTKVKEDGYLCKEHYREIVLKEKND